jgi:hypothetical protein
MSRARAGLLLRISVRKGGPVGGAIIGDRHPAFLANA